MQKSLLSLLLLASCLMLGCGGETLPPAKVETPSATPPVDKDGKVLPTDPTVGTAKSPDATPEKK